MISRASLLDAIQDTEAFVAANDDMIVVAFRGTQETTDWITNMDIVRRSAPEVWGLHDEYAEMHEASHVKWDTFSPWVMSTFCTVGGGSWNRSCKFGGRAVVGCVVAQKERRRFTSVGWLITYLGCERRLS